MTRAEKIPLTPALIQQLPADIARALKRSTGLPEQLYLIRCEYEYGDLIIDNGKFVFPKSHPLYSELNYADIPLIIFDEKCCELFVEHNRRIIPLDVYGHMQMAGLYETMDALHGIDSRSFWSMTAGLRTIFPLQRMSNSRSFSRLKKYCHNSLSPLKSYMDYFELFVQIARRVASPWRASIYLMPRLFFEKMKSNIEICPLYRVLVDRTWKSVNLSVEAFRERLLWENISNTFHDKGVKYNHYHADTLKHILSVATHRMPGFNLVDSELMLPWDEITEIINVIYKPTYPLRLMGASGLVSKSRYYSLLYPGLLGGNIALRQNERSIIASLNKIVQMLDVLFEMDEFKHGLRGLRCLSSMKLSSLDDKIKPIEAAKISRQLDQGNLINAAFFRAVIEFDH
ncbi:MAG: hypothetical protein ACO2ZM_01990 [Francisellaceae bacterium]